jgi:hypothetical protein
MWKREHRGSKTTREFDLNCHSKGWIATISSRDQEILQGAPGSNQVHQAESSIDSLALGGT